MLQMGLGLSAPGVATGLPTIAAPVEGHGWRPWYHGGRGYGRIGGESNQGILWYFNGVIFINIYPPLPFFL